MLIEFSVSNYRSFRERQTLSMVAAPRLRNAQNVFTPHSAGEAFPKLLKIAAIYGPNASGKSSLLMALNVVSAVAKLKPQPERSTLPVSPFRFDAELADKPSEFELNFISQGMRYKYLLALTAERITYERLDVFPKGNAELLYERVRTADGDSYRFGERFEADEKLLDVWRQITGPQTLFISQAVANSNEEMSQLRIPFEWISGGMTYVGSGDLKKFARSSQMFIKESPKVCKILSSFLQEIDIPVKEISIEDNPDGLDEATVRLIESDEIDESIKSFLRKQNSKYARFTHASDIGEASFSFEEESEGTQNLIAFWVPWFLFKGKKSDGGILAIDEFDSSLHPEIVAHLVRTHISSDIDAQLIFTTHDTHLMDTKLLRRDQIWLTERDSNGATRLRSIHDFAGREAEDVEKRYYEGRYRGLPFVKGR